MSIQMQVKEIQPQIKDVRQILLQIQQHFLPNHLETKQQIRTNQ